MKHRFFLLFLIVVTGTFFGQLPVARDTIMVTENGYVLKMPWANGINSSNVSNCDLNFDGKKDLVIFDRYNQFGVGRFRCFINTGNAGQTKYAADPDLSYFFPPCSNWAVMADYNCDGKEDLFCSTSLGIRVYENVSTPANRLSFSLVKSLVYSNYNPTGTPSVFNLFASSVGVPGISDIDNDGDLDILTFSPQGVYVEYHKNMSMETYGNCDSLKFQLENDCWGNISESNCLVTLNECAGKAGKSSPISSFVAKTYHAGSCLTCLDSDGDGDKDLIMGDVSCNTVQYVHNSGTTFTATFQDTTKLYPNFPNQNNTTQIKLNNFPCTYYVDVDGDNKKDLIATPNSSGENFKSVWYYRNTSSTNTVNFQFVKNNFLQDEMIEVGQNSFPVVFDYNSDGKKDLLIGTYGYYTGNTASAKLTLYENIGSPTQPAYSLVSRDYGNLAQYSLSNVMPTVGDIDGDNDVDICIGTSTGKIHWLENTAGSGNVCNFSVFKNNPFLITTNSAAAAPQLFDLDNDGLLDLLIGTMNGRIAFYRNNGTATAPAFTLVTNFLGDVDVKGNATQFGLDGYAAPFFYKENSAIKLLVGSITGNIFQFNVTSIASPFNLVTANLNNFNEGGQSTICYDDVNGDGKRDVFIGSASGGLSFFSSASPFVTVKEISAEDLKTDVTVFPNPATGVLLVGLGDLDVQDGIVVFTDLLGKEVMRTVLRSNMETMDVSNLNKGVYFATITLKSNDQSFSVSKKIIKE